MQGEPDVSQGSTSTAAPHPSDVDGSEDEVSEVPAVDDSLPVSTDTAEPAELVLPSPLEGAVELLSSPDGSLDDSAVLASFVPVAPPEVTVGVPEVCGPCVVDEACAALALDEASGGD